MFNMGPSASMMPDWLKQKTGGNTGITGGMHRGPIQGPGMPPPMRQPRIQRPTGDKPFGMGPMPIPNQGQPPVSTTMPVREGMRQRPNIIPFSGGMGGIETPGQQPLEENQLWRTYNRLQGGQMSPRMLL